MNYHKHRVLIPAPHPESLGALVRLNHKLSHYDPDKAGYKTWLEFRERTLKKWLKGQGDLVCDYCGKASLKIDAPANSSNLCTLDHVIPRAKGGDRFNLDNLVICCHPCNQKKGVKSYSTFKKQFDILKP